MFRLLRAIFHREYLDPEGLQEERWQADFSSPRKARFIEESDAAHQTRIDRRGVELQLKRRNVLAWAENPLFRYADLVVDAEILFPANQPYSAAGILFRYSDAGSYCSVLVSTKGYFRVETVFNGTPLPLVVWTELSPAIDLASPLHLKVIALGDRITLVLNGRWIAEVQDSTLSAGHLAFAAANYGEADEAVARLISLKVESRPIEVEAAHYRWATYVRVPREARFRLAETFASMGQPMSALVQLKRAWKSLSAAAPQRSQRELLLAADCALRLSLLDEAEEYLDRCVEADDETEEARRAVAEKAKLLYLASRYTELRDHAETAVSLYPDDLTMRTLLGHAYWNLGSWERARTEYEGARAVAPGNPIAALNAARAADKVGDGGKAFQRYMEAARAFFAEESWEDFSVVMSRLRELDGEKAEVHALEGKRAFAAEEWATADRELQAAYSAQKDGGGDPAVPYLIALLRIRGGERERALAYLERAVEQEQDYPPFLFRLAETRFLLTGDPSDPELERCLALALDRAPTDGWIANLAGQVALAKGDLDAAAEHLARAAQELPDSPEVAVNQAELRYRQGNTQLALSILGWGGSTQPKRSGEDGALLANAAGNLLVREERWEEADKAYEVAVAAAPEEVDYLRNRASCLVELGRYGEADELVSRALEGGEDPGLLDLVAYLAIKKGEFPRAEAAYRVGLERFPGNPVLLTGLAWTYITMARWGAAKEVVAALEAVVPGRSASSASVAGMKRRILEATTRHVPCASCDRSWRVQKDLPPQPALRLVAEPPDHMPAGNCPRCGVAYCVGCGKQHLSEGRFICPRCGERLKLLDDGLKKILQDWAENHNDYEDCKNDHLN